MYYFVEVRFSFIEHNGETVSSEQNKHNVIRLFHPIALTASRAAET